MDQIGFVLEAVFTVAGSALPVATPLVLWWIYKAILVVRNDLRKHEPIFPLGGNQAIEPFAKFGIGHDIGLATVMFRR